MPMLVCEDTLDGDLAFAIDIAPQAQEDRVPAEFRRRIARPKTFELARPV